MNPILIHKGDCTIFADCQKFLTFNIATDLDLTGFKAQFRLGHIEKTIDDISSKSFDVVLSSEETSKLWLGEQNGTLILTDNKGNIKTVATNIPFLITNDVVENEYQEIDLDIPESSGLDIKVRVQGGGVTSVNGMTGDVIIGVPSIEGLATKEELDTKQDKGNYALAEDVPTLVSQLANDTGYTTQLDVMQAIASIPQFKLQIVDSLPKDNPESMVLYLVPKGGSAPDVYDEYIWIEETGNYEFLGTTAVDLTGYVKNTDYASSKAAGLIRGYNANGFGFVTDSGYPYCESKSLASYNAAGGNLFIGKGTLESIKYSYVRDGIAKNTYSLSDSEKDKVRNWIGAGVPTVFETMPNIYVSVGKTYQYVGETTEEFTSGYFYKAVSQGISYIASDSNLTFDFDLFWSELASAGITLETLQMTEFDKERGGFSIIGTVESETNYRVQDINGIPLDVLLTQSIRSTSEYVGMSNRWYYKPAETFAWERVDVQPSAKTVPITQAKYDALATKDPNTLYLIEE